MLLKMRLEETKELSETIEKVIGDRKDQSSTPLFSDFIKIIIKIVGNDLYFF